MSLKEDIKLMEKRQVNNLNRKQIVRINGMIESSIGDISEEQIQDVFNRVDFNLHIKQVAENLKLDQKIVEKVIKSYVVFMIKSMNKVYHYKTRISLRGLFKIDFNNYVFRFEKNYYFATYKKYLPSTLYKRTINYLTKNYLKFEDYEYTIQQQQPKSRFQQQSNESSTR